MASYIAPSPVDTTAPRAEDKIDWSQHVGSCRIFYAERRCTCIGTEPPAETQRDAERPDPLTVWRRGYQAGVKDARERIRLGHDEPVEAAARPSADTEKLDRMRAAVERAIPADVVPRINFDWLMRDLRAALDA